MYTLNRHGFAKNAPRSQPGELNSGTVPKLRSPTHRAAASDFKQDLSLKRGLAGHGGVVKRARFRPKAMRARQTLTIQLRYRTRYSTRCSWTSRHPSRAPSSEGRASTWGSPRATRPTCRPWTTPTHPHRTARRASPCARFRTAAGAPPKTASPRANRPRASQSPAQRCRSAHTKAAAISPRGATTSQRPKKDALSSPPARTVSAGESRSPSGS